MDEKYIVKNTSYPRTLESLVFDLERLGLKPEMNIIVHSSMSSVGWISGGAHTLILALMKVITADGIIIMPTHSPGLTEPSFWENPPIPKDWWDTVRQTMTAFDLHITPSQNMGIIPEVFRTFPETDRSYHPSLSFAVWGKKSRDFIKSQKIEFALSDKSPLGELYKVGGHVLLMGTDHDSNTSLHLAETRIKNFPTSIYGGPVMENGKRIWKKYEDFQYDSSDFLEMGKSYESSQVFKSGLVGSAKSKLFSMNSLVDYAETWIIKNRKFD